MVLNLDGHDVLGAVIGICGVVGAIVMGEPSLAVFGIVFIAMFCGIGGLFAKLRDHGIDDGEMKRLGAELADGEAALFLLVEDCHQLRALHEVSRFPARLLLSTADRDLVTQVEDRFATDPWG